MSDALEVGVSFTLDEVLLEEIEKARGTIAVLEHAAKAGGVPVERLHEVASGHVSAPMEDRAIVGKAQEVDAAHDASVDVPEQGQRPAVPQRVPESSSESRVSLEPVAAPRAERRVDQRSSARPLAILRSWAASGYVSRPSAAPEYPEKHYRAPDVDEKSAPMTSGSGREPAEVGTAAVSSDGSAGRDEPAVSVAPVGVLSGQPNEPVVAHAKPSGATRPAPPAEAARDASIYPAAPTFVAAPALGAQETGPASFPETASASLPWVSGPSLPWIAAPPLPKAAAPIDSPEAVEFDRPAIADAEPPEGSARVRSGGEPQRGLDKSSRKARRTSLLASDPGDESDGDNSDQKHHIQGDVYLDGALVGRWISKHLGREAERASANPTAFDVRRGKLLPGATVR